MTYHVLCDSILEALGEYQDNFAEESIILFGGFANDEFFPNQIKSITIDETLDMLLGEVEGIKLVLMDSQPGLSAISDEFIHKLNKFKYLNNLA